MDNDDLAEIRTQLERLAAQYPELTPLNAALGPFLGRLLDGKKTVIGVVGAVLTTLLTPGGANATDVQALFAKLQPMLTGAAPILQPLFIALTLWGALGKIEKRLVNK